MTCSSPSAGLQIRLVCVFLFSSRARTIGPLKMIGLSFIGSLPVILNAIADT
jgi:hypothetical protein